MARGILCAAWLSVSCAAACSRTPEEPIRPAPDTARAQPATQATCPADPDHGGPMLPVHTLTVRENNVQFAAELVYRGEDTERGLMYRTTMADDHGMLFKLPLRVQRFWMHNTCISLDMLFVTEDGTIAGILEDVPRLNDAERTIGKPTTYVLELLGGASAKYGVREGMHVEIPAAIRDLKITDDTR